ncbi:putative leucine-rich repeat extensin-like protein 7 [Iris pallida]|uniref:Leucine-rich repeat extensin-like protein 7 n=1 Tax=Iris pallida TaxID=29817 RepID=A0AAX6EPJ6_IRIPA|nr:putative leucine-rich repeat extensin-like protein 7 [Iris pallida]
MGTNVTMVIGLWCRIKHWQSSPINTV